MNEARSALPSGELVSNAGALMVAKRVISLLSMVTSGPRAWLKRCCLILVILLMLPIGKYLWREHKISRASFEEVSIGMLSSDVEKILGAPSPRVKFTTWLGGPPGTVKCWVRSDGQSIIIGADATGRVAEKQFCFGFPVQIERIYKDADGHIYRSIDGGAGERIDDGIGK